MPTTIKSGLGEQTLPSRPLRTTIVPSVEQRFGAMEEQSFEPLPDSLPAYNPAPANPNYPEAAPLGAYNALQSARRAGMGAGSLDDLKRQEEAIGRARAAKFAPSRLSLAAKNRIEILCGISRAEKTVEIDGQVYGLQTLKGKENREALLAASQFDGTIEEAFEVRKQLLARGLFSIAGTDIGVFLGDDSMEARLELMDELPELVLTKLFDEHNKLFNDTREKYFPKTEAEVKEVIEDLKK